MGACVGSPTGAGVGRATGESVGATVGKLLGDPGVLVGTGTGMLVG